MEVHRTVQMLRAGQTQTAPVPFEDTSKAKGDATFSALCQLVALRLDAKRGFIVLIEGTDCHVLAEATRTVSPFDPTKHGPGDELMFGVQSIHIKYGIIAKTLPAFRGDKGSFVNTDVTSIDNTVAIFSDLQAEPLVKDLVFMQNNTHSRFYAETPILDDGGSPVGVLCVLDEKPRSNPREVDHQPLIDVAKLIMLHLKEVIHQQ